ncbi:MAG: ATP-binding protein [Candidatus Staskawiczbacteria bacterium]|nr:ATP-binding protein [Candidatus Staskawiczbacteria bacterium]
MSLNLSGNIDFLSVGIAIAAMVVMGFSVLFNNYKSITNRTFFYFVIVGTTWGFFNLMSYRITNNIELAFLFIKIELFLAVWYVFSIFRLFYVFPLEKLVTSGWWYKTLLIPIVIIVSLLTLTPFVFSGVSSITSDGVINTLETEPAFFIFLLTIVVILIISFSLFFIKIRKAQKEEKNKFYLLLTGSIITFALIIVFIPIQVGFFNNSNFISFGAIFLMPFVILASYAIVRHKLFNIRVIGSSLLVFSLSIVSFIEVTQTNDIVLIIYRSSVLFFILVFGILLIRGVIKEVKQREEIAKMAEDIRQAYAIEKKAKEDINRAYIIERRAKEELEKLDKVKDQFLAQTQHDLRTPLTSIMGYLDLLLNGTFGKQSKKTVEVIKKISDVSKNMVRKINDFLDTSAIQLGKNPVSLKPGVKINSILEEIVSELEFKASSKNIYLKLEKSEQIIEINADRERLKGALFNIIDNSIKFTTKGRVSVSVKSSENGKVLVKVQDTGIGIPKEKIKTMFETQFERTEQAQQTATGSGIGLYLSTQIIKYHNGKVWAESEGEGKGSIFYIELPLG